MKSADAARAVGMDEEEFREVNRIPARMLIRSGSTLLVPRRNGMIADISSTVADNATITLAPDAPPLRKVSLRAGRRDSVESVARRYRVSPAQVAQWNNTGSSAKFAAGQTVVVYLANKSHAHGATTMRSASGRSAHRTRVAASAAARPSRPARAGAAHRHVVARN
jgi:membrane-bound lytic murein transglycosylase D